MAALPGLLVPLFNPDIFWHLKAGDWILAHRALPFQDPFSYTRAGQPWLDFEWLSQVVFSLVYASAGMAGLWLLKALLLSCACWLVERALSAAGVDLAGRALGLAVFATTAFGAADARPDLFSLVFFCALLWGLEAWRAGPLRRPLGAAAGIVALFALWANVHAAFFCGWALIACYGAEAALRRDAKRLRQALAALGLAVAASFLNPYGWGPHLVALQHARLGPRLATAIAEWRPMSAQNPVYWPFWPAWGLAMLVVALRWVRGGRDAGWSWGRALAAALFGAAALAHLRMSTFFAAPAAVLIAIEAARRGWTRSGALVAALAGYALFSVWLATRVTWELPFNHKFVPSGAAAFMDENRDVLRGLRVYNPWEAGGYLEWRLPWLKPFVDGRYIFHRDLLDVQDASSEASRWIAFAERQGFTAQLLPNRPLKFPTTRLYPDGSTRSFLRPWYLFYAPRERWALVYWDAHSLLFVDRRAVPPAWLAAHQYRYVLPGDGAAFADARARRELPEAAIAVEQARHAAETGN